MGRARNRERRDPKTGAAASGAAHARSGRGERLCCSPGSGMAGWRHKLFTDPRMKMLLVKQKQLLSGAGHVQLLHQDLGTIVAPEMGGQDPAGLQGHYQPTTPPRGQTQDQHSVYTLPRTSSLSGTVNICGHQLPQRCAGHPARAHGATSARPGWERIRQKTQGLFFSPSRCTGLRHLSLQKHNRLPSHFQIRFLIK